MSELQIQGISIQIERKKIKNMYLRVHRDGSVTMSVPMRTPEERCRLFALSKFSWIQRIQSKMEQRQLIIENKYVTGEIHYLWGEPYKLHLLEGKSNVRVVEDTLFLYGKADSSEEERERSLNQWYRNQLQEAIPEVMDRCVKIVGKSPAEWRIKNMKTKWGTCNITDRRIWLNLQLVKKPPECLEYVITHELVHFYCRNHDAIFNGYMDRFYPKWREVKKKLNGSF